jgi:hypothetical protein
MGTENTNISVTLEAWAAIVLDVWMERIEKLKIGVSWQLADSFEQHVISEAGGDVARIEFAFKYYGKFVDMGVGHGVDLGSVAELKTERRYDGRQTGNRRRPKPWYNKALYSQTQRLMELMAEKYGRKGVLAIVENVDDNALKWGKSWQKV